MHITTSSFILYLYMVMGAYIWVCLYFEYFWGFEIGGALLINACSSLGLCNQFKILHHHACMIDYGVSMFCHLILGQSRDQRGAWWYMIKYYYLWAKLTIQTHSKVDSTSLYYHNNSLG